MFVGTGAFVTVSTCTGTALDSTPFDTQLAVYMGDCATGFVWLDDGNDDDSRDSCPSNLSGISGPTEVGGTYWICVSGVSLPLQSTREIPLAVVLLVLYLDPGIQPPLNSMQCKGSAVFCRVDLCDFLFIVVKNSKAALIYSRPITLHTVASWWFFCYYKSTVLPFQPKTETCQTAVPTRVCRRKRRQTRLGPRKSFSRGFDRVRPFVYDTRSRLAALLPRFRCRQPEQKHQRTRILSSRIGQQPEAYLTSTTRTSWVGGSATTRLDLI